MIKIAGNTQLGDNCAGRGKMSGILSFGDLCASWKFVVLFFS